MDRRPAGGVGGVFQRRDAQGRIGVVVAGGEQVLLAPHHPLGHAGGAAGVDEQLVVRRASPRRAIGVRRIGGGDVLHIPRPGRRRLADADPQFDGRQSLAQGLQLARELGVEHHDLGVGVVEQIGQLVVTVAIVDVERDHAGLVGGEGGGQVLGAVVQIAGDLGLAAGAGLDHGGSQGVGFAVKLSPRQNAITLDHGRPIGLFSRDELPDVGIAPDRHQCFLGGAGLMAACRGSMSYQRGRLVQPPNLRGFSQTDPSPKRPLIVDSKATFSCFVYQNRRVVLYFCSGLSRGQ